MICKKKKLNIVESPGKIKTISSFFKDSDNVSVISTYGHFINIESKPGNITFDSSIIFNWQVQKKNIVQIINTHITNNDIIYIGSDCDREGEAIAYHINNLINNHKKKNLTVFRLKFQEITKKSIISAMEREEQLNNNLINAYFSRVAIDYDCGFSISELLWKKLRCGYSGAGRVQSSLLNILCDKEKEINHFIPRQYFYIKGFHNNQEFFLCNKDGVIQEFSPDNNNKNILPPASMEYDFYNIIQKNTSSKSPNPLNTVLLQQSAHSILGLKGKKTMELAQELYEGLEINGDNKGLITYMRTDSYYINKDFIEDVRCFIKDTYGPEYIALDKTIKIKKNAQEAHEAIRPTDLSLTPEKLKHILNKDLHDLYTLIWNHTIISQMTNVKYFNITHIINKDNYYFKSQQKLLHFPGYKIHGKKIINNKIDNDVIWNEESLKDLYITLKKAKIQLTDIIKEEHKTQPPKRFNSGSAVVKMEEVGIGRPSTYASTIDSLIKYDYILPKSGNFVVSPKGAAVNSFLQKYFDKYLHWTFTKDMEEKLDKIANGLLNWESEVLKFHNDLSITVKGVKDIKSKDILSNIKDQLFLTLNFSVICKEENCSQLLILDTKINLFITCSGCKKNTALNEMSSFNIVIDNNNKICLGKWGFYIQETLEGGGKKNYSLPKKISPQKVDIHLLNIIKSLPKEICLFEDKSIMLKLGPYGFYIEHDIIRVPLRDYNIENTLAIELIKKKTIKLAKKSSLITK